MSFDTIFAVATGPGPGGLAVVRVSGPAAADAARALSGGRACPEPRCLTLTGLADPVSGERLDRGMLVWFPGPASFTGEDVVEFHVHGGRAVVAGILDALAGMPGLRTADPGEFTRRAFENGRIDLTRAEGLADLVAAETAAQRRQALAQADGALSRLYEGWRRRLVEASAWLAADLDFSDEDLPGGLDRRAQASLAAVAGEIDRHLADGGRGERLRDGFRVAIVGAPNVGKSTLLNRLARRDAAIVSAQAGTTRDVIEVHLDIGGYPVILADTAGLRDSEDPVEQEGVARARRVAAAADLRLLVRDAAADPQDRTAAPAVGDGDTLVVWNKIDTVSSERTQQIVVGTNLVVSAISGDGMSGLERALKEAIEARWREQGTAVLTRVRHRECLQRCRDSLRRAVVLTEAELVAQECRDAVRWLGRLTGRVDVEEILDLIFSEFCIGK